MRLVKFSLIIFLSILLISVNGIIVSSTNVFETGSSRGPATNMDSDFDGVDNNVESSLGSDPYDVDSDDDGVRDGDECFSDDYDGDGLPEILDPDSDADGISDGTELGITEPAGSYGTIKGTNTSATFGPNSTRLTFVPDEDPTTTTDPYKLDTDKDGLYDGWHDIDGDGILDENEIKGEDFNFNGIFEGNELDPSDFDTDDDGLSDGYLFKGIICEGFLDSDGDNIINGLEFDSDNDGIYDSVEMGLTSDFLPDDTNRSMGNFIVDADPKTTTDMTKIDSDNDTWLDGYEDANVNGKYEPYLGEMDPTMKDFDNDGLEDDTQDQDDDGDGYYDAWEDVLGTDPLDADDKPRDTDSDGQPDGDENNTQYWMDEDDDNDTFSDYDEGLAGTDPKNPNSKPLKSENGGEGEEKSDEGFNFMWILIIIIVVVVVILIVVAVALRRKKPVESPSKFSQPSLEQPQTMPAAQPAQPIQPSGQQPAQLSQSSPQQPQTMPAAQPAQPIQPPGQQPAQLSQSSPQQSQTIPMAQPAQPVQPPGQQPAQSPSTTPCPNCKNIIQCGILICPICNYNFSQPPPQQDFQ